MGWTAQTPMLAFALVVPLVGCAEPPEGLAPTPEGDGPRVEWDLRAEPLPNLPLPNDIATRGDPTSPTGLRLNASVLAPTDFEVSLRRKLNESTGWGTNQPITIPFDAPLDIDALLEGHRDYRDGSGGDYDFSNDAIYLIDVTPGSPTYQEAMPLDFGDGNFPDYLGNPTLYREADVGSRSTTLLFESWDEDRNGNGELDPGEDIDMDGRLDRPNVHANLDGQPGVDPYDDALTFYDKQSDTLYLRPVLPLLPKTTYAVVVTDRVLGENGEPVRSPFPFVNHLEQTDELRPAVDAIGDYGLGVDNVAFAWTFTTMAVHDDLVNIRNGLYGAGPMAWLAEDFPAEMETLFRLRDEQSSEPGVTVNNLYVIPSDVFGNILASTATVLFGIADVDVMVSTHRFPAYHVAGSFETPYLLDLEDDDPERNGVWPADLTDPSLRDRIGSQTVTFWCVIPRDEYKENPGEPAPVIINGHGYTLNRLDGLGGFVSTYSQHGLAACMIDASNHGIEVDSTTEALFELLLNNNGLAPSVEMFLSGRAPDIDGDGVPDSGDTWFGADASRSRDEFRQTVVDYMVLVRLLRTFDGSRTMPYDIDGDGQDELLGDFNADGVVDLGGEDVDYLATGVSLGGIMSSQLTAVEPRIVAAAPVSGGAGLISGLTKSELSSVWEPFSLQVMGPAWIGLPPGHPLNETCPNQYYLYSVVADGNDDTDVPVACLDASDINPGDTVRFSNLDSGKSRCARVVADGDLDPAQLAELASYQDPDVKAYFDDLPGTFRAGVPAAERDRIAIEIIDGDGSIHVDPDTTDCEMDADADIKLRIDSFGMDSGYRQETFAAGDALISVEEGLGLERANPALRSVVALSATLGEQADPANFAPYYSKYALTFMEGDRVFDRDPVNVFNVVTAGDPAVPVSSGLHIARSAGFFTSPGGAPDELLYAPHPDYGKTVNRVLVDGYLTEGITWLDRFPDYGCKLMDMDNHSNSTNGPTPESKLDGIVDGYDCPRLNPPLRLTVQTPGGDGVSGLANPMINDDGAHVFIVGSSENWQEFDIGMYMANQIAWYLGTRGKEIVYDECLQTVGGCAMEGYTAPARAKWEEPCLEDADCYSGDCVGADPENDQFGECGPQFL